jgi:hypothetical protein
MPTEFMPYGVFSLMDWLWTLLGLACLAVAASFALDEGASGAGRSSRVLGRLPEGRPFPFAVLGLLLPAVLCLFKCAQYAAFLSPNDSAVAGNVAWNVAHGYGMIASPFADQNYLGVHISFTLALLAPLLWAAPGILTLIIAQTKMKEAIA